MATKMPELKIFLFTEGRQILLAEIMKKTAELETRRVELERQMREVAPEACKKFLSETLDLENLLRYGRISGKYRYDGGEGYSLGKNRAEVKKNLEALCAAWNNEVTFDLGNGESHRVEYYLYLKISY